MYKQLNAILSTIGSINTMSSECIQQPGLCVVNASNADWYLVSPPPLRTQQTLTMHHGTWSSSSLSVEMRIMDCP